MENQVPAPVINPKVDSSSVIFDGIEASLGSYLLKKWWKILLSLLVSILLIIGLAMFTDKAIFGIAPFIIYLGILQSKYENSLFKAFALMNGYQYKDAGGVDNPNGILFNTGHDHHYSDVVSGPYKIWHFLLFICSYTTGYGKNSRDYHRGVMCVDFGIALPSFLLRRHKLLGMLDNEGESLSQNGYTQKLSLEGDFDKHFQVHIKSDNEINVLSLLTPDVMQSLLPLDDYELEMADNGIFYIYTKSYINKKMELIEIYKILDSIAFQIGQYAERQKKLNASVVNTF